MGSNRGMTDATNPPPFASSPGTADLERRLTELEIKATYTEDLLEELNRTVVRQQQQIDLLVRELLTLRDQAEAAQPAFRSLRDELPPHY